MNRNLIKNKKKLKFFEKTQNHDLFISSKRKNAVLEMSLRLLIMSKLDHKMSKIVKAGPFLQPISKFDLLKNCTI